MITARDKFFECIHTSKNSSDEIFDFQLNFGLSVFKFNSEIYPSNILLICIGNDDYIHGVKSVRQRSLTPRAYPLIFFIFYFGQSLSGIEC